MASPYLTTHPLLRSARAPSCLRVSCRSRRRSLRTCPPVSARAPALPRSSSHGTWRVAATSVPEPPPGSRVPGWSSRLLRLSSPVLVVSALRRCRSAPLCPLFLSDAAVAPLLTRSLTASLKAVWRVSMPTKLRPHAHAAATQTPRPMQQSRMWCPGAEYRVCAFEMSGRVRATPRARLCRVHTRLCVLRVTLTPCRVLWLVPSPALA